MKKINSYIGARNAVMIALVASSGQMAVGRKLSNLGVSPFPPTNTSSAAPVLPVESFPPSAVPPASPFIPVEPFPPSAIPSPCVKDCPSSSERTPVEGGTASPASQSDPSSDQQAPLASGDSRVISNKTTTVTDNGCTETSSTIVTEKNSAIGPIRNTTVTQSRICDEDDPKISGVNAPRQKIFALFTALAATAAALSS